MDTNDSGFIEGDELDDLVGSTFADRYRLTRLASAGANTVIFDADDATTGRPVTVKVVRPDLAVTSTFRDRFDVTMRSVAALSHPNIAAVYDWGSAPFGGHPTVYVVNEQLRAGSLRDLFDRGRRLSPSQALAVGLDTCRALDHAHRRGFVHGELTPSKIVFGDDRRLRVVDLGLAALLGEQAWQEPATVATHVARYASPEQALSLPIDGKTDVYALCLALIEGVTGSLPFAADSTVATLAARVGRLMPVSADLGPLASVLERAGRPESEDRASASMFGRMLVQAAEKLPRPEPLPLLSSSLFETPVDQLRAPEDPTGGVTRPRPAPVDDLVVVPIDEPDPVRPTPEPDLAPGGAEVEPAEDAVEALPPIGVDDLVILPAGDAGVAGRDPDAAAPATPDDDDTVPIEGVPAAAAADDAGAAADDDDDDAVADDAADAELASLLAGAPVVEASVDEAPVDAEPVDEAALADAPATFEIHPLDVESPPPAAVAVEESAPRRRGVPWKVVVPIVLVAALAGLGVLAYRLFSTPSYEVPVLTGVPQAEALAQIEGNGWEVSVQTERSDDEPRVDHVVRTAPPAGADLAEGEPFLLVVSEGPVLRSLPELTGLTLAEAQAQLLALDLVVAPVEQYDEAVPPGQVIGWSVPEQPDLVAGGQVEPGTEVEVVSSLGPAPRTVPTLTGTTFAEAQAAVEPLALAVTEIEQVFSDTVPAGVIVTQVPAAGDEVDRGTTIQVTVSKGPDVVTLPDLAGTTYDEAATLLAEAGFVPVLSLGSTDGTFVSASVGGEPTAAGDVHPRGTQVDLVFL